MHERELPVRPLYIIDRRIRLDRKRLVQIELKFCGGGDGGARQLQPLLSGRGRSLRAHHPCSAGGGRWRRSLRFARALVVRLLDQQPILGPTRGNVACVLRVAAGRGSWGDAGMLGGREWEDGRVAPLRPRENLLVPCTAEAIDKVYSFNDVVQFGAWGTT